MHIEEVKRSHLFYKFPSWLLEEPYKQLSDRAKIMYMLFWDRLKLSVKNDWYDKDGKVYIFFTIEQLKEILNCSEHPAIKAKKELINAGLIEEKRQFDGPNKIYVIADSATRELHNVQHVIADSATRELHNVQSIKTEYIKTNLSRLSNQDDVAENIDSVTKEEFLEPVDQQQQHSIFDEIQENFGRGLKPIEYETVKFMLNENSEELVSLALKRAVLNGKPSINYMDGILRSWRQKNITSVLEAEQELNQSNSKQPVQTPSSVPEWSNPNYKEPVNEMSEEEIAKILAEEERLKKLGHKFI